MKSKPKNYNIYLGDPEHALRLFDNNRKNFIDKEEFDILPYSERYYSEKSECFNHLDKAEIGRFIEILKEKGYIEQTGQPHNIVRLTDKGKTRAKIGY